MANRLLGLCPLLVVTTSILKAFSISVLLLLVGLVSVLLGCGLRSMVIWQLKGVHFAVIASVSTLIVVNTVGIHFPAVIDSLGIYALLIAANCQVISQLQELAEHRPLRLALPQILKDGVWVLVFTVVIALIREFATYGVIFHDWPLVYGLPTQLPATGWLPFLAQPGGALIILGLMLGALNFFSQPNSAQPGATYNGPIAKDETISLTTDRQKMNSLKKTSQDENTDG